MGNCRGEGISYGWLAFAERRQWDYVQPAVLCSEIRVQEVE